MKAKNRPVVTAKPDAEISAVMQLMKLEKIGCVVLSENGEHADGIVSVRDIVYAIAGDERENRKWDGSAFLKLPVSRIMTRKVRTCLPGDNLKQVMKLMTRWHNLHVPVLEGRKLCGIISIDDVVKYGVAEMEMEALVLRDTLIARG
ncbi:MAG: CBS domain-containing protein [Rhodospirillales bacterium]